jgi:adenylate cyclase
VLQSLALLEQAVALDPRYGPALADAANCRQILDVNGWAADRQLNRRKAVDFARTALQVSNDPEPVAISAFVLAYFGEDIDAAVALVDNALRLNPSFAKGWYMSGMTRLYAGRPEEAIECFQSSLRLNPRDRVGRRNIAGIGIAHFFNRRFDEAVPILRPVLQEFPRWATPYCVLASCHAHLGFLRESEAIARRLKAADPCLVPNAVQFRDAGHRALLTPGLKLAGRVGPVA